MRKLLSLFKSKIKCNSCDSGYVMIDEVRAKCGKCKAV